MIDQITPEELAIYLGAKLQLRTADQIRVHHLAGINNQPSYKTVVTDSWHQCEFTCAEVRPIVRSLGQLNMEIEHCGESFVPTDRIELPWFSDVTGQENADIANKLMLNCSAVKIFRGEAQYKTVRQLALWHFDIFNWLRRTGSDGKPLALAMGLGHWGEG